MHAEADEKGARMRERLSFSLLQHYVFFSKGGWMSKRERAACEKREIYKIQFPVLHVMEIKHNIFFNFRF
jgi:hypothetical protein